MNDQDIVNLLALASVPVVAFYNVRRPDIEGIIEDLRIQAPDKQVLWLNPYWNANEREEALVSCWAQVVFASSRAFRTGFVFPDRYARCIFIGNITLDVSKQCAYRLQAHRIRSDS